MWVKKKGFPCLGRVTALIKIYLFHMCSCVYKPAAPPLRDDRVTGPNHHGVLRSHLCDCDDPQNWR